MKIAVFSLGQFVGSNVQKLKDAFQGVMDAMTSRRTEESGAEDANAAKSSFGEGVWKWMTSKDPSGTDNLQAMRLGGKIEEFYSKFQTEFLAKHPGDIVVGLSAFKDAFLSMCTFDDAQNKANAAKLKAFADFLAVHQDTKLVIVSHTNHEHFGLILKQLEAEIPNLRSLISVVNLESGAPGLTEKVGIYFAPSFMLKTTDHPSILATTLSRLGVDPKATDVVSFLNSIDAPTKCPEDIHSFVYHKTGTDFNCDTVFTIIGGQHYEGCDGCVIW